ncbi:tRNA (N6-isopentenyl adenosine(37)-C2)-methylthiotransferase MiaB [Clostridiales Family XIII bacterium ASD5510]|uniref:tRNA-2-methylthio-N(6)-dimethylallyladenosine synthase n=1 Tax=Hominibacterium faecale TaxID=2839743 RepID=A0A9J6QLS2_9FIRM|nr:tRNA (N6-isopentenyl adenosine(37)-C2)-methylthiotransferase MiaB [Hominibacterium faecale]MCU7376858.1 tRNA (N6-isopentenyl adenosine(37)-C2)-methylthiotransferase MiaB [Hominibacterium faecale]MCU7379407.1 tRNA (N6-isopentenyl adenosine(37)-C2)-methylthiotransferase MiaB [Hominibacterium faecale]
MNKPKTYHITTFGCQMNEHDSETIAGMLSQMGFCESPQRDEADVVIINTCSVRENADKRFFGTLGQLKKKKLADPEFTVCVCGCMMQQQHIIDSIKTKYPWVDIIFGTHNIHQFPQLLESVISEKEKIVDVWEDGGEIVEGLPAKRLYKHKAFVNIMYGCNNFCTYCIVPYTRGRERSRRPLDIIDEVKLLVADGVREVTLLGQNVNSYRGDEKTDFADLIYRLNEVEGLERIRFMTSHPKDLSDKLIQAYVDCNKLCNYIHLPVQSGSSPVLARMNRKYTKEDYLELIAKLRKAVPDITISTDIIVGFPGETEADFEETLDLVGRVRYDSAFTFLYSIRKGTPAEEYEDQIPEDVKHQRFNRLVETVNSISAEKNAAYVGKVEKVLVEGVSKTSAQRYTGRTEGFKLINFPGTPKLAGKIVDVKVTEGKTFSLEGEVL